MAATPLLAATSVQEPVTIFEARKVVTMERSLPAARFVAVANGIILGVADRLEALAPWTQGRTVTVERRFADKVLFPGLVDPHIHPMQAAVMLNLPFLAPDDWHLPSGYWPGIVGQDAWRARLRRLVAEDQSNPLVCWGHHELFHGPLDKAVLDEIAPDRPLFVWQRSFHDIYVNSTALESIGLGTAESFAAALAAGNADPHHSSFERGVFSETGLLVALGKLQSVLLSPQRMAKGFADLATMMRQRGVTTTSDMATGIFARFDIEAGLIARGFGAPGSSARAMLMPMAVELMQVEDLDGWLADKRAKFTNANVGLDRRVKLLADGAFFAQNMRMGAPGYSDGHIGKWITEPADLRAQVSRLAGAGFALHIHVNGDEGADEVLSALARLPQAALHKVTLEHLGYCTEAQAREIARMGLMVSAQPNYIRVLGKAYSEHGLGPDRAALMNRLGSLERGNVPLGLHSDFNMAPIDPFYLAWIAETREGIDGTARAPEERLSRAKALRAITIEAAQVIGMDGSIGSIAAGKKADFTVLNSDPHDAPGDMLKEMPIAATIFEGRVAEG
ncbi:MAG: amidohydrolase family protein [Sphingomonadaceae bacterium]|nr:amidohydrolase family protein [Sphingomonadaceae bacterium]